MKSCSLDATTTSAAATTTTTSTVTTDYCSRLNVKQEQGNCHSNSFASQVQVNENAPVKSDASEKKSTDDKIVQGPCLELTADSLDFLDGCSNSTKDGKTISSMFILVFTPLAFHLFPVYCYIIVL